MVEDVDIYHKHLTIKCTMFSRFAGFYNGKLQENTTNIAKYCKFDKAKI